MMSNLGVPWSKKRRSERVYKFRRFGENGYPAELVGGSFRENVKALVEYGHLESKLWRGLRSWSFQLEVNRHPPIHVLLFVVEEPIEASSYLHCKPCQFVGWGHHMICNKKYHFLLPSKDTLLAACFDNNGGDNNGDNWWGKVADLGGHILHGVFHSNGFGHLLSLNGLEAGSDLPGHSVMDLWDRLCTGLRARKVSLKDVSEKKGMELRLVYGVAEGQPWFHRWGYSFSRGTFCVTPEMYERAIEAIRTIPITFLLPHLHFVFSKYLALSENSIASLGDLFHFLLELKSRIPSQNSADSFSNQIGILTENSCRWSPKRVEMAVRVIVESLKQAEFRWVSRQEVRDSARVYIGDTGLLDFVLKSLGNHVVGKYLVRRSLNPVTKVLEYCLQDISNMFPNQESGIFLQNPKVKTRTEMINRAQITKDMVCLYKAIFSDQTNTPISSAISMAARIILDSKYLTKDYEHGFDAGKRHLFCTVKLKESITPPPYESFLLKTGSTIDELKREVEKTFSEIYYGLRTFQAESIVNLNANGSDVVLNMVEYGRKLVLEGSDRERKRMEEVYENGDMQTKVVDCRCGAEEDDGERMICCDICEAWQHSRCVHIPDDEEIPTIFLCNRCEREILLVFSPMKTINS